MCNFYKQLRLQSLKSSDSITRSVDRARDRKQEDSRFHLPWLTAVVKELNHVLHNTTEGNFCHISQYVNKSDSSSKKESSRESPGRENRRQILFSLPCFTHFSLCSLRMNIRTSLNHRKFIFSVFRNYLSREFRSFSSRDIAGNRCRVPLVGGVTAMTGENWEFL